MVRFLALSAALAFASPALAGDTAMTAPLEAASLHQGTLDMVAFYRVADESIIVTATFASRIQIGLPQRVVMALDEGDAVAFGMPGHPGSLYSFSRNGATVTVSVEAPGAVTLAAR